MVASNGRDASKNSRADKGKGVSPVSQLAEANRRRASGEKSHHGNQPSRNSSLLKRKYGRAIGARYDGSGRMLPADYMSMFRKDLEKSIEVRPPKRRRSQRPADVPEVFDQQKTSELIENYPKVEQPLAEDTQAHSIVEIDFDADENESDEEESEEWEEVEVDIQKGHYLNLLNKEEEKSDEITVSLDRAVFDEGIKTKRERKSGAPALTREQRDQRKLMHKIHLIALVAHVSIRNKWCSDFNVRQYFKQLIPEKIKLELHPQSAAFTKDDKDSSMSQMVLTRKLLDGLRHLMELWKKQFRVKGTASMAMTSWADIFRRDRKVESKIDKAKFVKLMKKFRGSRDVGAQGFCALLRAADVDARLVCSLQPLDFTSNVLCEEEPNDSSDLPVPSEFPVYWVEVWDLFSTQWIAIDPVVLGIVEPASMNRKSRLEPPMSDKSNMMRYVVAFDDEGSVRDVTRRYAFYYNAKTRKKRITNTPEGAVWYSNLLNSHAKEHLNERDTMEDAEMESRNQAEELPSSIQDFKGHPL